MKQKLILLLVILVIAGLIFGVYKLRGNKDSSSNLASASQSANYKDYTPVVMQQELDSGKKVVLFFYADWCPECRQAEKVFQTKSDAIPENVTVLKVIFRADTELEKKYGILSRHTFVQVGPDKKWLLNGFPATQTS